jgi:hypothetical protein
MNLGMLVVDLVFLLFFVLFSYCADRVVDDEPVAAIAIPARQGGAGGGLTIDRVLDAIVTVRSEAQVLPPASGPPGESPAPPQPLCLPNAVPAPAVDVGVEEPAAVQRAEAASMARSGAASAFSGAPKGALEGNEALEGKDAPDLDAPPVCSICQEPLFDPSAGDGVFRYTERTDARYTERTDARYTERAEAGRHAPVSQRVDAPRRPVKRILACGHHFHARCIIPWVLTYNNSCPLCRARAVPAPKSKASPTPPALR